MNKVYIDLGCNNGQSVVSFLEDQKDPSEWDVFAFDPLRKFNAKWREIEDRYENVRFMPTAAWNHNGTVEFTERVRDMGSSMNPDKQDYGDGAVYRVPCFDFSEFLRQFTGRHVIVKMDVEGAEFEIMDNLLKDGTIAILSKLYIEWHDLKMGKRSEEYTKKRQSIEKRVKQTQLNMQEWNE